jgi:hypothetical protein
MGNERETKRLEKEMDTQEADNGTESHLSDGVRLLIGDREGALAKSNDVHNCNWQQ